MEKKEELDRDRFYRVIEGNDVSYSFIALGRENFGNGLGVNLIIKIPYTQQIAHKVLTPNQARKLASELIRFADEVEVMTDGIKA